jgi:hypothetical protein
MISRLPKMILVGALFVAVALLAVLWIGKGRHARTLAIQVTTFVVGADRSQ